MTKTMTLKEAQVVYSISLDKANSLTKPVVLKREGQRFAVLVPIVEYEQFVSWQKRRRRAKPRTSVKPRRTRTPRKTGTLTDLIGIVQSKPSGEKIRFEEFMTKHGYEQIDRDDS